MTKLTLEASGTLINRGGLTDLVESSTAVL